MRQKNHPRMTSKIVLVRCPHGNWYLGEYYPNHHPPGGTHGFSSIGLEREYLLELVILVKTLLFRRDIAFTRLPRTY